MIERETGFIEYLLNLQEAGKIKEHDEVVRSELKELLKTKGWQLLVDIFRQRVEFGLTKIRENQSPDFYAGQIACIEEIREQIKTWITEKSEEEQEDNET